MKWSGERVMLSAVALVLLVVPVWADHPVVVTMLVESFDGCGCGGEFADPISCGPCPAGVNPTHPDCDVFGPSSLDYHWKNSGFPSDMAASSDEPAQGFASQVFSLGDVFNNRTTNLTCAPFGSWDHVWIDYDNLESPSCGTNSAQRFELETTRVERGLPAPDPNLPAYFIIAVRRDDVQGDGDTSDIATKIWMDLDGMPTGSPADAPVFVDVLPGTGWQDVIVNNLPKYVTRARLHLLVDLGPQGALVDATKGERVTIKVDNLRFVYTGIVPETETDCSNGIDDDQDGLTDCEDLDCTGHASCPCNKILAFDTDFDRDVDQEDFGVFQVCYTGAGPDNPLFESSSAQCKCLDITGAAGQKDNAIDQMDFAKFLACASGPMLLANESCDD